MNALVLKQWLSQFSHKELSELTVKYYIGNESFYVERIRRDGYGNLMLSEE